MGYGTHANMTKKDKWVWLAAILEGEGTFNASNSGGSLRITLGMTDKDTVSTAARIMANHGWPYKKTRQKDHYKDLWVFEICGERAAFVALKILPYMHTRRRRKIASILKKWYRKIMLHHGIVCRRCGAVDPTYSKKF